MGNQSMSFIRQLTLPLAEQDSIFFFGPRGTGKTFWLKQNLPDAIFINLLAFNTYNTLAADPSRVRDFIPKSYSSWIVIDEVQRVPELLNEVHDLIEAEGHKFILTGSSSRKLKRSGVNLLAGRAIQYFMHPLIIEELNEPFDLEKILTYGLLPKAQTTADPKGFLETYIETYIREEVFQEALIRNMQTFAKFLEVACFSQGESLNMTAVGQEVGISRQLAENYFSILEDLLIAVRIPIFTKRAKRKLRAHPKFYYFDIGVYYTLRPKGLLDSPEEMQGPGLETLFLQSVRAINDYKRLNYSIYYWRTQSDLEVDFVVYGEHGLHAFEIKRNRTFNKKMLKGLNAFKSDYPMANLYMGYGGQEKLFINDVVILPVENLLRKLAEILA